MSDSELQHVQENRTPGYTGHRSNMNPNQVPHKMPQSFVQIYVHIVFSTKNRKPFLQDLDLRSKLHAYLAGACHNQQCPSIQVGGVEDHVHLLVRLGKMVEVSSLIREIKKESSKWVKAEASNLGAFQWQSGFGAFSISPAHVGALTQYIRNQESHHHKETFQEEFRRLCQKYDVDIDERYVWD